MRLAFTVTPITFGLDKFFNVMVDWPEYLAPWINDIGLMLGALTPARLASVHDPPLRLGRG